MKRMYNVFHLSHLKESKELKEHPERPLRPSEPGPAHDFREYGIYYIAEEIIGKKTVRGRVQYKVKWKRFYSLGELLANSGWPG